MAIRSTQHSSIHPARLPGSNRAVVAGALSLAVVFAIAPASWAASPANHYASYAAGGSTTGLLSATLTLPGGYSAGSVSSSASFSINSSSSRDNSLPAGTPFADIYGPSLGFQYLSVSGRATTTITFSPPMPARSLGINFGDIDAEEIVVSMSGTAGALSAEQIGFQSAYNYQGLPAEPGAVESGTTLTLRDAACVSRACDTNGAAAWLQAQAEVSSVAITATALSGSPRFQLWIAAGAGQSVSWAPTNTTLNITDLPVLPNATAVTSGDGVISYVVDDPGTTGCSVDATSGAISATAEGVCQVAAVAAETGTYLRGEEIVEFAIIDNRPRPDPDIDDDDHDEGLPPLPVVAAVPTLAATGVSVTGLAASLGLVATGLAIVAVTRERTRVRRR